MRSKKILIFIITLFVFISGIVYSGMHKESIYSNSANLKDFRDIMVDVSGAVVSPGVYTLAFDSRVADAIEAAGGFTENAALEYVNKADFLRDGTYLYIPGNGESLDEIYFKMNKSPDVEDELDYAININEAGIYNLMLLPGIGEKTATKIISYREEHGSFRTKEEILEVSGIGEATLKRIKDYITLD